MNKPYLRLYHLNDTVDEKLHKVYKDMYGGDDVAYSNETEQIEYNQ